MKPSIKVASPIAASIIRATHATNAGITLTVLLQIDHYVFERRGLTTFVHATPDQYKVQGAAVDAYRKFYLGEKMHFATWAKRPVPHWVRAHADSKDR
jgi:hypothetical protein